MANSIQTHNIVYSIDINTGTTETLSNIYMNNGHIRFVTDNYDPVAKGSKYEDDTSVSGIWEKDILKVDGIDEAGIQVDIAYGGTYANLNGFSFTIFNMCADDVTPYHKGIVNTSTTYLVGSTLTLYVVVDNVFHERWTGIISDYAFTDEWFKFNADDASIKGFNLFPKQTISKTNFPNTPESNIGKVIPVCVGYTKYAKLLNVDDKDYSGFGASYMLNRLRYNISTGTYGDNDSLFNRAFSGDEISQEASSVIEKSHLFAVNYRFVTRDYMATVGVSPFGTSIQPVTQDSYIVDGNGYGIIIVAPEAPAEFIGKWITFSKLTDDISTTKLKYYKVVDATVADSSVITKPMVCLYVSEPINDLIDEGNLYGRITTRSFDEIVDNDTIFVNVYDKSDYNHIISEKPVDVLDMYVDNPKVFSDYGNYTFYRKTDKKIQRFNPTEISVDYNRIYIRDGIYDEFIIPSSLRYAKDESSTKRFDVLNWSSTDSHRVLDKSMVFDSIDIHFETDAPQTWGEFIITDYTRPTSWATKSLTIGWKGRSIPYSWEPLLPGVLFHHKFNKSYFDPSDYDEIYPLVIAGGGVHGATHLHNIEEFPAHSWIGNINLGEGDLAGLSVKPYGLSRSYNGNVMIPMGDASDYRFAFETFYANGLNFSDAPFPADGSKTLFYCKLPLVPTKIFRKIERNTSIYDILGITGDPYTRFPYAYRNTNSGDGSTVGTGYYANVQNCGDVHEAFYRIVECSSNNKIYQTIINPVFNYDPVRAGENDPHLSPISNLYREYCIDKSDVKESCLLKGSIQQEFNTIDQKIWNNFDKNGNVDVVFQIDGFNNKEESADLPYLAFHKTGLLCRSSYTTDNLFVRTTGEYVGEGFLSITLPYALRLILQNYNTITADYTAVDAYRTNWNVGRYVTEQKNSFDYIKELCEQYWLVGYTTRTGSINFENLEPDIQISEVDYAFDDNNIVRDSINGFSLTPLTKVCNEITVKYDYNAINENYDKVYSVDKIEEDTFPDTPEPTSPMYKTATVYDSAISYWWSWGATNIRETYLEDGVVIAVGTKVRIYFDVIRGVLPAGGAGIVLETNTTGEWYIDYTITVADYIISQGGNGWNVTMVPFAFSKDVSGYSDNYRNLYLEYNAEDCKIYYDNPALDWHNYVQGVESYSDAKDLWGKCKNSWWKSKTINQYPIKELSWVPDMNNFFEVSDIDNSVYDATIEAGYLHFVRAIDWTTEQKYQVTFKIPITSDTSQLDLMKRVTFYDKLITGNPGGLPEYFFGYITKMVLKPYEYAYEIEMTGKIKYLTLPIVQQGYGDIIEDQYNTIDIIEDQANINDIIEVGS